ncbi:DUF3592 domain-containing protein [Sphingomonas parva]|nr:DUF3592 domain-containing protein [Sphingomonas parva]
MHILHLVAIALLLVGAALGTWGVRNYRRLDRRYADATARWVKGSATVVEARILERERTDSNDNSYTYYEPRLRYHYAVEGVAHEGQRVALCGVPHFNSPGPAEDWLGRHGAGAQIDLWYDPAQPGDSAPVLDRPSLFAALITVVAGVFMIGVGAMMLAAPL